MTGVTMVMSALSTLLEAKMNKIQEVLDLVEHHPVRSVLAVDKHGMPVEPCDPDAVCFCLIGAIAKVYNIEPDMEDDQSQRIEDVYNKLDKHPLVIALSNQLEGAESRKCPSLHVAGVFDDNSSAALAALRKLENEYEDE